MGLGLAHLGDGLFSSKIFRRIEDHPAPVVGPEGTGAGDGNRTHDIQLGKLTFYL